MALFDFFKSKRESNIFGDRFDNPEVVRHKTAFWADATRAMARALATGQTERIARPARTIQRSISAAMTGLGTSDMLKMNTAVDYVLRANLSKLRASSRALSQNSGHVKQFLRMVEHHVIGPNGVGMQNKARNSKGDILRESNQIIEDSFDKWATKPRNCDVRNRATFRAMQRLAVRIMARDGECFIRLVKNFGNSPYRFALQIIPADMVDEGYWDERRGIRCGIEYDEWGAAVAYHVRQDKLSSFTYLHGGNGRIYQRIPAEEMIHLFVEEFPDQSRGIPWVVAAMIRLHQLGMYEEAEVMAARLGASKMGFLTAPEGDGKALADGEDEMGNLTSTVSPGVIDVLPPGYSFEGFDPTHPSGNFGPFHKSMTRSISAAVGVSYNLLANDLEGVNYSSIRAGVQEDREAWRSLQQMFGEQFMDRIMDPWAEMATLSGKLDPLPAENEHLINPIWRFRGWAWIDPLKDITASITAINAGLKSREDVLAEQGIDFEELCEKLAEEQAILKEYGVQLGDPIKATEAAAKVMQAEAAAGADPAPAE